MVRLLTRAARCSGLPVRCRWYASHGVTRSVVCALLLALSLGGQNVEPLTGTQPLTWNEDLADKMMAGAHRFVERKIAESRDRRQSAIVVGFP